MGDAAIEDSPQLEGRIPPAQVGGLPVFVRGAHDASARRAHDGSQRLQPLVGERPLPFCSSARRVEEVPFSRIVGPPGGRRKKCVRLVASDSRGSKPLATNAPPPGEEPAPAAVRRQRRVDVRNVGCDQPQRRAVGVRIDDGVRLPSVEVGVGCGALPQLDHHTATGQDRGRPIVSIAKHDAKGPRDAQVPRPRPDE